MGKKTKRKHRHGRAKGEAATQDSAEPKGPAILQRIRHADPKTRHAALEALLFTSFDPDTLLKLSLNSNLLQAVREQVMDRDLNCATSAAACLARYAAFCDQNHALTAGWMVLVVGRLKECLQHLQDSTSVKQQVQWWELTEQCLTCMVHLLENNPMAVDRLVVSHVRDTQQLRRDSMLVLSELLLQTNSASAASATAENVAHRLAELQDSVRTICCRSLHSAWDDNPNLLLPWLEEAPEAAKQTLEQLHALLLQGPPTTARMHAVGAWVAAYSLCRGHNDMGTVLSASVAKCLALLQQSLVWDIHARAEQLVQLQAAFAENEREQADLELEQQVISSQDRKKESARDIARRLKQKDRNTNEDMDEDTEAAEAKDETMVPNWEAEYSRWQESIRPLQLALEVTANLTSAYSDKNDDDQDMGEEPSLDPELAQALSQHGIPDQLVQLLSSLASHSNVLPSIQEDISDLQSKTAIALGHCLTHLGGVWLPPSSLWQTLENSWHGSADESARQAVSSAMVMALRSSQTVRTQQIQSLDFMLQLLQDSTPIAVRDAVCMLGILCSCEAHSAEVNHRVVQALIQASNASNNAMVLAEVLSVLMDIYSDDDCHPQVFDSLKVLQHFQQSLPRFKQRITVEQRNASDEDVEQWKETAMNSARFIQYKKGHES